MELTSYELSRDWFNFCFENPTKVNPNHTALYFFCIEHCNRLGWKKEFGLPTTMAKEAIGVHSYNTYIKTLNSLVEFGFIKLVQKSKNQYSSNIIALLKNDKALDKALDKAIIKHVTKQSESTEQSIDSIIKQLTKNKEQLTKNNIAALRKIISSNDDSLEENKIQGWRENFEIYKNEVRAAYSEIIKDAEWLEEKQRYHPNLNIVLTLEKSCKEFWATEAGWKNKKSGKTTEINWKSTFNMALSQKMNQVWNEKNYQNGNQQQKGGITSDELQREVAGYVTGKTIVGD